MDYSAPGNPGCQSGTQSAIGFTGAITDPETGFLYLRSRYYDPTNGSFLTRDPLPGLKSDPGSQNGYSYAEDNPTRWVDPAGLDAAAPDPGGCAPDSGDCSSGANTATVSACIPDPEEGGVCQDQFGDVTGTGSTGPPEPASSGQGNQEGLPTSDEASQDPWAGYSQHARERAEELGLTPESVDRILRRARPYADLRNPGNVNWVLQGSAGNDSFQVVKAADGTIITIIDSAKPFQLDPTVFIPISPPSGPS